MVQRTNWMPAQMTIPCGKQCEAELFGASVFGVIYREFLDK
jgi:hypothetical protein